MVSTIHSRPSEEVGTMSHSCWQVVQCLTHQRHPINMDWERQSGSINEWHSKEKYSNVSVKPSTQQNKWKCFSVILSCIHSTNIYWTPSWCQQSAWHQGLADESPVSGKTGLHEMSTLVGKINGAQMCVGVAKRQRERTLFLVEVKETVDNQGEMRKGNRRLKNTQHNLPATAARNFL